jgi:hypothetical protein
MSCIVTLTVKKQSEITLQAYILLKCVTGTPQETQEYPKMEYMSLSPPAAGEFLHFKPRQ